jgi:pyruvate dehydrogenase E1 component alpha subunit
MKLTTLELVRAYERMHLIRKTEGELAALYLKEKIMSFVHFYVGQEAVAVGVCDALKKQDSVLGNHRSHGHYLAKGGNLGRMVSELLGKADGLAHGKGGSMHMTDVEAGFVGSTPILGSAVPLAAGVGFAHLYNKKKHVAVVFIGDGAFEEGGVAETINLAGLFHIPLLIVIENNLFAVNTALKDRRAPKYSVRTLVKGLGAAYLSADGNKYQDVRAKADTLVASVRAGKGPAVLECMVFRHMAHSAPIFDESCRVVDTKERRMNKDSVKLLRRDLARSGVSEKRLSALEKKNGARVAHAIAHAQAAPFPKAKTLYTDLYAN